MWFYRNLFLAKREFECLRDDMPGYSEIKTTSVKYHMVDIERQIHFMK